MAFLAVTQPTADWLLGKASLLDAVHEMVLALEERSALSAGDFIEGPVRLALSEDETVVAMWHVDYLTGTGDEAWGLIDLDEPAGVRNEPSISREVLERALYVINQRLQGLFIDGSFIHRAAPNGAHTCLAGRGTSARQFSIAYVERDVYLGTSIAHSLISIGPRHDLVELRSEVVKKAESLQSLVVTASALLAPARGRSSLPSTSLPALRASISPYIEAQASTEYQEVSIPTGEHLLPARDAYRTVGWTYQEWMASDSPLSAVQRKLLMSDAIERHPIRIVGPGGSGKTLLMQLLAIRRLKLAEQRGEPLRVLYIVHNAAMAQMVKQRFSILLGAEAFLGTKESELSILTLSEYGRRELSLEDAAVIDPDAHAAKQFQLDVLHDVLDEALAAAPAIAESSNLFREIMINADLFPVLVRLIMTEISTAIKGHGIGNDERRYVQSERRLSRLHGVLTGDERTVVFDAYRRYNRIVFEELEVLDSDDVALSLLGRLRTPIWDLKRRTKGYDYVFVDETQLFNENERRILPLLTKGVEAHVPIVLALDEAQDLYGQSTAGLATLGITDIASESLFSIHRSTKSIVKLAFFVIQRSTDLFGPDFPDFTGIAEQMEPDSHPLASPPRLEIAAEAQRRLSRFVLKRVRGLRKANLRQLAVICHAEQYWDALLNELRGTDLPLHVIEKRGDRLSPGDPVVVLTRPAHSGGQEFDAVVLVGLEHGLIPPRVMDNDALATAVEQQALREMYLSITRARYQVVVVLPAGSSPNEVIQAAEGAGLIKRS